MNTQELTLRSTRRYGITEKKKAELDALSLEIIDAENEVQQLQAIVTSLSEKSIQFQQFLADAGGNRTQALNNKNLVTAVFQQASDLKSSSQLAFDEVVLADSKMKKVAKHMKEVVDKIIFSAEAINKLADVFNSKTKDNLLFPPDLVSRMQEVGPAANNAVALALVALKSTFAAQVSNIESEAAAALEYTQSVKLVDILEGAGETRRNNLMDLLHEAYLNAETGYSRALAANNEAQSQLNVANKTLNAAQVKLKSLQAGFAAANAAALAS